MATANTVLADINEIACAYFLAGEDWSKLDNYVKEQYEQRCQQAKQSEVDDAVSKAKVMATSFVEWAQQNGHTSVIENVWWTARPNTITEAVGFKVDQKKNPTDVLVKFTSGFLGLSAKATKGTTDIGFKNPGVGTVDKKLDLNLREIVKNATAHIIQNLSLPKSAKQRKQFIRENSEVKTVTEQAGSKLLSELRDVLYNKMLTMSQDELRQYLTSDWMDAQKMSVPYVKVTGFGDGTAEVVDPLENDKLNLLKTGMIVPNLVGNESIGISTDGIKIMKIRFKFESEKMASSVKLSGESW